MTPALGSQKRLDIPNHIVQTLIMASDSMLGTSVELKITSVGRWSAPHIVNHMYVAQWKKMHLLII
jgi:hypothetical protein